MTDAQLERCRKRLEQFLVDLLAPVGRSERRHWGSVYVRGLLLDGERKSVEPMAKRVPDGNEQAMQQFVGQSPWDWKPVWERLALGQNSRRHPVAQLCFDDTYASLPAIRYFPHGRLTVRSGSVAV
jgi:SRSO17 transposase